MQMLQKIGSFLIYDGVQWKNKTKNLTKSVFHVLVRIIK